MITAGEDDTATTEVYEREGKSTDIQKPSLNVVGKTDYIEQFFPKKRSFLPPKWEKFLLCLVTFSIIALICVFSLGAISMELLVDLGTVAAQIKRSNITEKLESALMNLTNHSIIYEIKCPVNYVHSHNFISCAPACNHWDFVYNDTALLIETIIILLLDITGVLLGVLTLISWPFVKSIWKFPQVTILFLVICLTLLTSTLSIIDLPGFYCGFDVSNSYFDVIKDYQSYLMGAGVCIYYLRIAIMFWTSFTLFNILLSTMDPSRFNPNGKFKNIVILIEVTIAFGIPLIFIIAVLAAQIKLFWNAFGNLPDYANTAYYMLGRVIPDYFTASASLIFVALILTRLRFLSIDSKNLLGNTRKLSPLEIRLFIYCVVSSLVFYFFIIEVCLYLSLYETDANNMYNHRACITLNSPIIETRGNITTYRNASHELIPDSDWNGGMECEGLKPYLDQYQPIWLTIYNICYRVIVNAFFLIFILKTNLKIWIDWLKWIVNRCLCFKKSK